MNHNPNYDAANDDEPVADQTRGGMFDDYDDDDFGPPPASSTPQFQPAAGSFDDGEDDFEDEDVGSGQSLMERALRAGPATAPQAPQRPQGPVDPDFLKQVQETLNPNRGKQKSRDEKIEEAAERGALEYACVPQGTDGRPMVKEKVVLWGDYRNSELHAELLRRRPSLRCAWLIKISTMAYDAKGDLHQKPVETRVVRTDRSYTGEDDPADAYEDEGEEEEDDYGMVHPFDQPDSDDDYPLPDVPERNGNGRSSSAPDASMLVMRDMFREQMQMMQSMLERDRDRGEVRASADPMEQLDRMSQIMERIAPKGGGGLDDAIRVVGEVFDKGMNSAKAAERPGMMDMIMMPMMMMMAPMMMNTPMFKGMMDKMGAMMPGMPGAGASAPGPDPNAPPLPMTPQPNALPGPSASPQQPAQQPTQPQMTREQMAHGFRHNFLYQRLNQLVGTGNTRYTDERWWAEMMVFQAEPRAVEDLLKIEAATLAQESLAACPNVKQHVANQMPEEQRTDEQQVNAACQEGMTEWWSKFQGAVRELLSPQKPAQQQSNPQPEGETDPNAPPPENPIDQ